MNNKEPWWKSPYRAKNVRTKKDTSVEMACGEIKVLEKGAFISLVRRELLGRSHRFYGHHYDDNIWVVADTPIGFALVLLEDLDM